MWCGVVPCLRSLRRLGFKGVLKKPYTVSDVRSTVSQLCLAARKEMITGKKSEYEQADGASGELLGATFGSAAATRGGAGGV